MGNPVKQYCVVFVECCPSIGVCTTIHDAETDEVLYRSRGALNYYDKGFRDLAEERTGRTCLEVIRK